jgi:glycine/D-amino acid oxidase-like deaminating enzyme
MSSTTHHTPEPHILIIGAGATGLVIAHGLQQAGVPYIIFEAEDQPVFRARECTMATHWSLPMLESLLGQELAGRLIKDASVDPSIGLESYLANRVCDVRWGYRGAIERR